MQRLLSLSEITALEDAHQLGGSTLGVASEALLARWRHGMRDAETLARLLFLIWYDCADQSFLPEPLQRPSVDELIGEAGGETALPADTLFIVGFVANLFPYCFGAEAEWERRSQVFLERAVEREPQSRLLRNWPFFIREADDTRDPRIYIEPEIHARYAGRGELGRYMQHMLLTRLGPQHVSVPAAQPVAAGDGGAPCFPSRFRSGACAPRA